MNIARARLTSDRFDTYFGWCAGASISAACTVLVALAAADTAWPVRVLLGGALAAGWLTLGLLYPTRRPPEH